MKPEWWSALLGGTLIGLAAALMWWANGRIAGVSGILAGILDRNADERRARVLFVAGLLLGGLLHFAVPQRFDLGALPSLPVLLGAGLLVGIGTRLGEGCTSGHGVCGIGRGSPRSMVATLVFMGTAAFTVFVTRHVL
ncbi:MAG: YeeE/YedE thiosulfate transporter family protein [Myxococcales bacterium]